MFLEEAKSTRLEKSGHFDVVSRSVDRMIRRVSQFMGASLGFLKDS